MSVTISHAPGSKFYNGYVKVSDTKANNTSGGDATSGSWETRDINTEDSDNENIASIATNQITLEAGIYRCLIRCPAHDVNNHMARLYDTTATATLILGSNAYVGSTDTTQGDSIIQGDFTLSVQSVLEIQHRVTTTKAASGYGLQMAFGVSEVYTVAEFWREA